MTRLTALLQYVRDPKYRTLRAWGALVLIGLVVGGVYVCSNRDGYTDADPAYNASFWKQVIEQRGARAAYVLFKQKNAHAPTMRQHFAAHVFGGLIADKEGVNGVTECDASFGFGCYHGFFARLISTQGTEVVRALDSACVAKFGPFGTGCQHGIGHGILEYVGYQHIDKALLLCAQTTQKVPLLGCTSGVFMEYSTPLAGPSGAQAPGQRPYDKDHPYQPCTDVGSAYRESCYFELGHWYFSVAGPDVTKLQTFCDGVPGGFAPYCFLGLGDSAGPRSGYDLQKSLALCDAFAGRYQTDCRAGVSWSMYANPTERSKAAPACALPDATEATRCSTFADLTEGQSNQ